MTIRQAIYSTYKKLTNARNSTLPLPGISADDAWNTYLRGKGYAVSTSTALKVAVVLRCADVVAKTMASLGCHLIYKDSKSRATNNGLYDLLRMLPNPDTTAYEFWHMYIFSLMLTKGAYAKVVRDKNGFIREIWNIPSRNVVMRRNKMTGERYLDVMYEVGANADITQGEKIYEPDFMYTPGLRFTDGEEPEDFIRIAAEVLGLTIDLNAYAKDFFENGSNMGGFISYPGGIKEEAFKKFKDDWERAYGGVVNQHKWAILEGGFTAQKMDSNPEQAQALESRKFQIIEVCRLMGVTPHKVFSLEGVNYNSIEQLNIEFVQETLDPMDERISETIYKDLFNAVERRILTARFNINKLLKGDTAARTAYYNTMRQNGVFSANKILDLEDMKLIPAEEGGDLLLVNGNMISLKNAANNLPKSMQSKGTGTKEE